MSFSSKFELEAEPFIGKLINLAISVSLLLLVILLVVFPIWRCHKSKGAKLWFPSDLR
jgi:hypothetical protein